jgi:hypothetical protein
MLLILLHILDRSLDPMRVTLSQYAGGSSGLLMVAAFVALSISTIGLAIGLFLSTPRTKGTRISFLLLLLVGVLMFLAGVFVADPIGATPSGSGIAHAIVSLSAFVILIVAMAQWTRAMEATTALTRFSPISARLTFLTAFLFVLFLLSGGIAAGLVQRVFVSGILVWQLHASRVVLA